MNKWQITKGFNKSSNSVAIKPAFNHELRSKFEKG